MPIIIALVLAIPTYGISLVVVFIYYLFKMGDAHEKVETAIKHKLYDKGVGAIAFDDISFAEALSYSLKDEVKITYQENNYIEFEVNLDNKLLLVVIGKEPLGNNLMINSVNIKGG